MHISFGLALARRRCFQPLEIVMQHWNVLFNRRTCSPCLVATPRAASKLAGQTTLQNFSDV